MRKHQRITAFYMELLGLIAVFLAVILTLTQVFALAKGQSSEARVLTRAVRLAENTAELFSASESPEEFLGFLGEEEGAHWLSEEKVLEAWFDRRMEASSEGDFRVTATWDQEGGLAKTRISVYWQEDASPVYTLDTAVYLKEEA